ncbi:DUF4399 domain-containing protein [Massilia sp. ST3]|uniref:DUF4399 domain-containing protein n=1 Tax=Massilia sp. ST3 TaxID=2824903 RepID=UPI001B845E5F|nr:DUF4399 domain-containing protein [Massilia sp. ST3]MBQ5946758.1 DUF4399 domain-containing protein [Massilia sp. ST3]
MRKLFAAATFVAGLAGFAPLGAPPAAAADAPANAYCYIGWPRDGEVLAAGKPFRVWFGLRHMGVAPKGVAFGNTGHHHLLIDTELPPAGQVIPSDRNHLHFGAGETETMIELPPGKHTLQLLMGDENHVPHKPPVHSRKITITVR